MLFAWPPTACTNRFGNFVKFAKNVEHVMTRYRGVSVVRVLFRFDRNYQLSILQIGDSAVVTGLYERIFTLLVSSVLGSLQGSRLIHSPIPDG